MPRFTAHAVRFSYHEKYKRNAQSLDLGRLPDGDNFLAFALEAWNRVADRDEDRQRSFVTSPAIVTGRVALLKGRVGHYGAPAQVRDVASGQVLLTHDGNIANEPEVRLVIAVPGETPCISAYMVVEEIPEGTLKKPYLDALKELWNVRYPKFTLVIKNVSEAEGWLETASMAEMTVTYLDQSRDLSDYGQGTVAGNVHFVLKPPKGKLLPRRTLDCVKKHPEIAGRLVGRDESERPDSITVRMRGEDGKEKTFAIDQERTPLARWVFSDWGVPALNDDEHRSRSLEEISGLLQREGVKWNSRWEKD
ncbi:Uncharacterised protein [Actinomyces bovis]|uniref:Uncharacterized protein n=1 Tax=Actinomyces bovis TaxID=1658 RepID=A0ABY1VP21_9ACTO|nr:hypothetical protein [Actinomyces bovis]SPT53497.1 Uncharacterised protein [Actinomyces bovis]VEG55407.1 Uncharacterised protein [Actinomyces israelii]